ncbi:Mur ligase domain-containing protein [Kitasatospora sp. NPDC049285]|uniref:Mur ligase domain-containing protein n=1 Tax=Kitasatospora sp. NPDC049285 TaxID=3157096 RepID=UPI003449272D
MDPTAHPISDSGTSARPALPALLTAVHLVDIGAPGMEGLAHWLVEAGADVTGSVLSSEWDSPVVASLVEAGVRVLVGFDAAHVRTDRTAVVWSGVFTGPHPELDHAQTLRLPILARTVALKAISRQAGSGAVAVAGSHSTTTAAAALAHLLDDGHTGWILNAPSCGGTSGHAAGHRVVTDYCPDNTTHEAAPPTSWQHRPSPHFLHSEPKFSAALIMCTSANAPHYEDNIAGLNAADHLARLSDIVVLPTWDNSTVILRERLSDRPTKGQRVVTVGTDPASTVWIMAPRWTGTDFRVVLRYQEADHPFVLPVAGRHHVLALCAAIATALVLGEDPQAVAERAASFRGVQRSLVTLGTERQVTVVDSRARHPREIAQDVEAARMLTEGSLIVALAPDGIARASTHATDIGSALGGPDAAVPGGVLGGADQVLLLPVTTTLSGHTVPDPLDAIEEAARKRLGDGAVHRVLSGPSEPGPEQLIGDMVSEGDLVLVVGTGQAERLGPRLLLRLAAPAAPIPHDL